MRVKDNVKLRLRETKEQKNRLLIEQKIVQDRFSFIFESFGGISNVKNLNQKEKDKLFRSFFTECHRLQNTNLINEQFDFLGILKNIFGNLGTSALEGIVIEPLVNTILSKLGLGGFFKDFLTSFISTNPQRVLEATRDCKSLTRLVSEAVAEASVMMLERNAGLSAPGYAVIRNALGKTLKGSQFVSELETNFADHICNMFDSILKNAKGVLSKIGSDQSAEKQL